MKKIISSSLVAFILVFSSLPVLASENGINDDAVFQNLIEKRAEALINNDIELLKNIDENIKMLGGVFMSDTEARNYIFDITDQPNISPRVSYTNTTWIQRSSTQVYRDNTYIVDTMYAQPKNNNCNLWQTAGSIKISKNSAFQAGAVNVISVLADNFSKTVSVYNLLKNVISGFASTTEVNNIECTYVTQAVTSVSFKYVRPSGSASSSLIYISSKSEARVDYVIPTLKYSGSYVHPSSITDSFNSTITMDNFDSDYEAAKIYASGSGKIINCVGNIQLKGIDDKSIKTFYPLTPSNTEQIY